MGVIAKLFTCSAVLVACFAVIVGLTLSGDKLGIGKWTEEKNDMFKGMLPFSHTHEPWGFTFDQLPSQEGKTFLITGANVGLGYWTSYYLAGKGGHVVMGCRSEAKCTAAMGKIQTLVPGASLEMLIIDLQSFASIKAASVAFKAKHETLNSLILNAGIMATPYGLTKDGIEQQIGTNHFGHFLLTKELRPVLVATAKTSSTPPTIVPVASNAHYQSYLEGVKLSLAELNDEGSYVSASAYGQSKLCNVLFAQELAEQLKEQGVLVNAVHPGLVTTELIQNIYKTLHKNLPAFVASRIAALSDSFYENVAWTPEVAALTQLYAAVGPTLLEGKVTGQYYHPIARKTTPSVHAQDAKLQKAVWAMTEEVVASKGY